MFPFSLKIRKPNFTLDVSISKYILWNELPKISYDIIHTSGKCILIYHLTFFHRILNAGHREHGAEKKTKMERIILFIPVGERCL